jgi:hypothetical protein
VDTGVVALWKVSGSVAGDLRLSSSRQNAVTGCGQLPPTVVSENREDRDYAGYLQTADATREIVRIDGSAQLWTTVMHICLHNREI